LYVLHDFWKAAFRAQFNAAAAGLSLNAAFLRAGEEFSPAPGLSRFFADHLSASALMMARAGKDYSRPVFNLPSTRIDGRDVAVTEETIIENSCARLLRFRRACERDDPKILLVAPMSGHFATMLRDMAETLLPAHDVYVTDWKNARDIDAARGDPGLEDYIGHIRDFLCCIGPGANVVAVSQSTVPVLAAVSLLAAHDDPAQPETMTLIGGPIDTRAAENAITRYARQYPVGWLERSVIDRVPDSYEGAGRSVYPGFLQLAGLIALNPAAHMRAHMEMYGHFLAGREAEAAVMEKFYDEYFSVSDIPAKLYLDTIRQVFQEHALPRGLMEWKGERVDPAQIRKTALLTVEGGLDDVVAPGQTYAAHALCSGLGDGMKFHHLEEQADHYGIFSGAPWRERIGPLLSSFIRGNDSCREAVYDPVPGRNDNAFPVARLVS
jgi:poly(3-hydroxybutyrate) depolymerase